MKAIGMYDIVCSSLFLNQHVIMIVDFWSCIGPGGASVTFPVSYNYYTEVYVHNQSSSLTLVLI